MYVHIVCKPLYWSDVRYVGGYVEMFRKIILQGVRQSDMSEQQRKSIMSRLSVTSRQSEHRNILPRSTVTAVIQCVRL